MSEYKETVTTSKDEGVDDTGRQVEQQTRQIDTSRSADGKSVATNVVWFIVGILEILLVFRFILKLFGANPSSGFVDFIYKVTNILTAPFDSIFGATNSTSADVSSVFEPSIIVAAVVYALIGWGIVKLLNVSRRA